MVDFQRAIYYLEMWGLTDVILPFMLIFAIVFATLAKAKVFGSESRKFNLVVGLAISLLVVIPHVTNRYPPGKDVVTIINTAIPQVSAVAVAIIMFLVLIGIFGAETSWWGGLVSGVVVIGALVSVVYIFGNAIGWFNIMPSWLSDPSTQALVVIVLVFGLIVWFVTAEPGKPGVGGLLEKIGNAFKRGG